MTADSDYSDFIPADGAVAPGGWEPLATCADDHGDGRIHITAAGCVRLHGVTLDDVPGFSPAPEAEIEVGAPEGEIGWLGQTGGTGEVGTLGEGLSEGIAEQVVRVLAPLGLIFDAESPLLPDRD